MIRGIPLHNQSTSNFDYLSLPPQTLRDALRRFDPDGTEAGLSERERQARDTHGEASLNALTVTREVRRTMEEVLGLLNDALAAHGR